MRFLRTGRSGASTAGVTICLALLVSATPASAQRALTLQNAIDIALEKSYDMKSLLLSETQAQQGLIAAKNSFKTNVTMNIDSPSWTESVSAVQVPNGLPVYNSKGSLVYRGRFNITQPLPTNGNITLSSQFTRTQESTYLVTTENTLRRLDFLSSLTLRLTQPLFTINRIQLDLKNAELNYETAERSKVRRQLDIVYNVTQSFFDLYSADRNLEMTAEDVDQQTKTTAEAKQKFDSGLIAEVQYLQMEVDLAEANDRLVSAQAALKRQNDAFNQLIGLEAADSVTVQSGFDYTHFDIDLDKAIQEGLKNRSEIREGEISIEQLKITVRETAAQTAIQGNLIASYDVTGVSDSALPFDSNVNDLFDSSWRDLERRPGNRSIGFSLSIPVWDWGVNAARVQSAEARLEDAQNRLVETKKTVERSIKDVVTQVRDAENRIEISKRRQDLAQKTFDISLGRFEIGDITADQLAQDRTRLNSAKLAYLNAYTNYQLAVANLKRNTLWDFAANSPVN
jgi:outer membrane protein